MRERGREGEAVLEIMYYEIDIIYIYIYILASNKGIR